MLKQKLLKKISILFVGDEDTGKTSIIEKYKTGEFNRDIQKTRGYILTEKENITFLDVSGKSSILYNIITPDAVVLTCDIKKLTSIYNLKYRWYERVVREVKRDMYIAINKSDYDNHKNIKEALQAFKDLKNIKEIFIVSALDGYNINLMMNTIAENVPEKEKKKYWCTII
jgi:GTPase SAR1 family protein